MIYMETNGAHKPSIYKINLLSLEDSTIDSIVEENKKLEKKLKVSISVRGKLLNKLSSLHRLVKNLEPTGDLMKQYQEFILTLKREHAAIKDEEMMKDGV